MRTPGLAKSWDTNLRRSTMSFTLALLVPARRSSAPHGRGTGPLKGRTASLQTAESASQPPESPEQTRKLADLRTHDLPRNIRQATRDFEENQPAQLHHRRASGQDRARRASELQNGFHELRKGQLPRKMSQCFAPEKRNTSAWGLHDPPFNFENTWPRSLRFG